MSTITATTLSDAAGTGTPTFTGFDVWSQTLDYDQTGTPAVNDSLNVTSVTDSAAGQFTVNFTNSYATAFYAMTAMSEALNIPSVQFNFDATPANVKGTASALMETTNNTTPTDVAVNRVQTVGDLA